MSKANKFYSLGRKKKPRTENEQESQIFPTQDVAVSSGQNKVFEESKELPPDRNFEDAFNSINRNFVILLIGEALLEYLLEAVEGVFVSDFAESVVYFTSELIYYFEVQYLYGSFFGIVVGWIADSYTGKYVIYMISQLIYTVIPAILLYTTISQIKQEYRRLVFNVVLYSYSTLYLARGARDMFIAEQVSLNSDRMTVRVHLILIIITRYIVKVFYNSAGLLDDSLILHTVHHSILAVCNIIFIVLIFVRTKYYVRRKVLYFAIEESVVKSFKIVSPKYDDRTVRKIRRGQRMMKVFFLFFPFIIFGLINNLISLITFRQFYIFAKGKSVFYKIKHVTESLTILLTVGVVEFLLVPLSKKYGNFFLTDLKCLCIAYVLITLACMMAVINENILHGQLNSLTPGSGQLVIYFGLDENCTMESPWFTPKTLLSREYLSLIIPVNNKDTQKLKFTVPNFIMSPNNLISIEEMKCISYAITYKSGVTRLEDYDPVNFGQPGWDIPTNPSTFAFSYEPSLAGRFYLKDIKNRVVVDLELKEYLKREYFSVPPGKYYINFVGKNNNLTNTSTTPYSLYAGCVYSFVVHRGGNLEVYELNYKGDFSTYHTLSTTILRGMSVGFALVSAYHFTYVEAPDETRAFLYSYVLFGEVCGLGHHLWRDRERWFELVDATFITVHLIFCSISCLLFLGLAYIYIAESPHLKK